MNGDPVEVDAGATVEWVIDSLDVGPSGIAVALNGAVVPRSAWGATGLADDDRVEVLSAAQGG